MTDPAPTIPPPAGYASWADAFAAAAGGTTGNEPIGLAKGETPVGESKLGKQSGPGLEAIPGQLSPQEVQGTAPINDLGQTPNASPYKAQDILSPGAGTADQILQLQADLVHAGLLNIKDVRRGIWDAASQNAYKVVLAYANQHALSKDDAMSVLLNNPELGKTAAGSTRAVGQTTNPLDIAAQVSGGGPGQSNTARDLIGQDLPQAEVKDFQNWYMQQEQGARKQLVNADLSGQGATVGAPPSLSGAAQDYIKQHNLSQMTSYGTAARMLQFFDLLKTPGGHP